MRFACSTPLGSIASWSVTKSQRGLQHSHGIIVALWGGSGFFRVKPMGGNSSVSIQTGSPRCAHWSWCGDCLSQKKSRGWIPKIQSSDFNLAEWFLVYTFRFSVSWSVVSPHLWKFIPFRSSRKTDSFSWGSNLRFLLGHSGASRFHVGADSWFTHGVSLVILYKRSHYVIRWTKFSHPRLTFTQDFYYDKYLVAHLEYSILCLGLNKHHQLITATKRHLSLHGYDIYLGFFWLESDNTLPIVGDNRSFYMELLWWSCTRLNQNKPIIMRNLTIPCYMSFFTAEGFLKISSDSRGSHRTHKRLCRVILIFSIWSYSGDLVRAFVDEKNESSLSYFWYRWCKSF